MKKLLFFMFITSCLSAQAQKIDFNLPGRPSSQVGQEGFVSWAVPQAVSDTLVVDTLAKIKMSVANGPNSKGKTLRSSWSKTITQGKDRLVGDGFSVFDLDSGNNTPQLKGPAGEVEVTVWGLSAGEHTILAYHNNTSGYAPPTLDVYVDGVKKQEGVVQTQMKERASESGYSYVKFTVTGEQPVKFWYRATPAAATDYAGNTCSSVFINGIIFDQPNPATMAHDPQPVNQNVHADVEDGVTKLTWTPATKAVKHHLFFGTDANNIPEIAALTDTVYSVSGLYSMNKYYWRIDEETADGNMLPGETWMFQPRHLAFPGAEGYGRFAIGGRGGVVYHVTNLNHDHNPGSFLYGLTDVEGPRTIVFDVSGLIVMDYASVFTDANVTIAGQTAPGKGICLKHCNLGISSDNICRFLRARRGGGDTGNAMGVVGANNTIIDHVTASWGTDETFSSRGAYNVTFQRSMIAEALGIAHHKNYPDGVNHGFAATIGGDVGSFHHNLLVDCQGRNWSMGGGLDGDGYYSGRLDIFNNVCYNWGGRTTDGGAHEVNFVGNYYKEGPAVKNHCLFTLQLEGTGKGTQSAYIKDNIRDNLNGTLDRDKDDMKTIQYGQTCDWTPFVNQPFFVSYATIDDPVGAYKKVLSDVGANQPVFDNNDQRMIRETRDRSYTYVGSLSGIKGEIDDEADCGGFEVYPEESRAKDFDADGDGIPAWFENIVGTSDSEANNNVDSDKNGYTDLEEYLNWMAEEHRVIAPRQTVTISMKSLFAGYTVSPVYTYTYTGDKLELSTQNDTLLVVKAVGNDKSLNDITLKVVDADNATMTRTVNIAVTDATTGIDNAALDESGEIKTFELFTLNGAKVKSDKCNVRKVEALNLSDVGEGIYLLKTIDNKNRVNSYKIVKH